MSVNTGDSWSAQCFRVDGETVWAGCFAGVLTLKEPVDVPLLQAERRHCGGGGGGHRGLKVWRSCRAGGGGVSGMRLGEGVVGDGVRPVPLPIKATVEHI